MGDHTAEARMARYRARRAQEGKRELRVWVTDEEATAIKAYLAGSREALQPTGPVLIAPPSAEPRPIQIAVEFPSKPPHSVRELLRKLGLRWNDAAQQWRGYCENETHVADMGRAVARLNAGLPGLGARLRTDV